MKLHKDHGVNPTMRQCFWCKESTGEILLLGNAFKGEAPMYMVTDYNPCDQCMKNFDQGILLIEVSKTPLTEKQPDLSGAYPTGSYWVVTEDAIKRMLQESIAEDIFQARKAFITKQDAIKLGLYPDEEAMQYFEKVHC